MSAAAKKKKASAGSPNLRPVESIEPRDEKAKAKSGYIVKPWYDLLFFIGSPLLALLLGFLVQATHARGILYFAEDSAGNVQRIALPLLLSSAFTHAHLFIVFFRSHGNKQIFKLHPLRFVAAPIALFTAAVLSQWIFVTLAVVVVWWDVYHSSMQTFGLGRLYDLRYGNDPKAGRTLDILFNILIYTGPVLAGVNLWEHLVSFNRFQAVNSQFFSTLGYEILSRHLELRWAVIGIGVPFLIYFLYSYVRLARNGYKVSPQKVALFFTTAVCSIFAWGFGSFGEAFLIMNFFHALQYFAIVWWSEKRSMSSLFRVDSLGKLALPLTLLLFLAIGLGYGFWRVYKPHQAVAILALSNVVSVMHFWYDGFIWSVRKKQVS